MVFCLSDSFGQQIDSTKHYSSKKEEATARFNAAHKQKPKGIKRVGKSGFYDSQKEPDESEKAKKLPSKLSPRITDDIDPQYYQTNKDFITNTPNTIILSRTPVGSFHKSDLFSASPDGNYWAIAKFTSNTNLAIHFYSSAGLEIWEKNISFDDNGYEFDDCYFELQVSDSKKTAIFRTVYSAENTGLFLLFDEDGNQIKFPGYINRMSDSGKFFYAAGNDYGDADLIVYDSEMNKTKFDFYYLPEIQRKSFAYKIIQNDYLIAEITFTNRKNEIHKGFYIYDLINNKVVLNVDYTKDKECEFIEPRHFDMSGNQIYWISYGSGKMSIHVFDILLITIESHIVQSASVYKLSSKNKILFIANRNSATIMDLNTGLELKHFENLNLESRSPRLFNYSDQEMAIEYAENAKNISKQIQFVHNDNKVETYYGGVSRDFKTLFIPIIKQDNQTEIVAIQRGEN